MLHFAPVQIVCKRHGKLFLSFSGKGASDEMKILTVCNRGETTRLHFLHPSRFLLKYLQRRNRSTECVMVVQNIAIFDFLFSPEIRRTFLSFLSSNEFSWASVI